MNISEWLDEKNAEKVDVSQIVLPADLSYDNVPDETIYFKEINPCGVLCADKHPFSTVERYGHWYFSRGRSNASGIHSAGVEWSFFTKNRELALKTARSHIE